MTPQDIKIEKLINFKQREKFSDRAWELRGLNPSSIQISSKLQRFFDESAEALIIAIQYGDSAKQLKDIVKRNYYP